MLHLEGNSISYHRVMSIRKQIAAQICEEYRDKGFVCPPSLHNNVFTTAAIDNIDHNLSSTTAKSTIHWTGISIFQHPNETLEEKAPIKLTTTSQSNSTIKLELPTEYLEINPIKPGKPEPPVAFDRSNESYKSSQEEANNWTTALINVPDDQRVSFSAFYSQQQTRTIKKSVDALLPLVPESITSHSVVNHCMTQVKKIIEHFNPGQSMVITADEPVYALLKQNQLMFPEKFEDSFCKMGDLHIEMTFQSTIGDWLEGSGWTEIYENANISTSGRIDSFLKSSHVKRTRYAHQVTLKVLLELGRDAFKRSDMNSYEEWKANRINESSTALYWFTVIDLQAILFMFVRSVRESNFKLYFETLNHMLPWFFSLDHTNYARWLTVYIEDIRAIEKNSSPLYTEFCDGKFTVNKTCRLFSSMGEDQAHEQHNKVIKDDGGAVGIFDNEQAVLMGYIRACNQQTS